ncbi:patatin-like phospholipase family protein [Paraferrimonas haliotis]|uniref:Patatin n=1 Tax=Paraferrimonas haliotis TaxID=2013866 RepID=A0AA37TMC5_9GAMM|nr:patatin-like phospholipase family protein [Paraferrimonas haliotis]GLS82268.1 patatin [Paraferrimonas haliotis]
MQRLVSIGVIGLVAMCLSLPLMSFAQPQAQDESKPRLKVGLALSGGGAKGAAHVGVLKVLEENNIPVDFVTGTSIGSFVGGLYALGYSADEIEAILLNTNWDAGFSDSVPREALGYRDKQHRDIYNIPINLGISEGEVRAPSGWLQGQTMSQLVRESVGELPVMDSFDDLAIPFRAVATNLETREAVVLSHGSLGKAMQASMTVPGILNPVEWDGMLLVDGGLANNMPVDVVKAMGADVVIAVDIGSPLLKKDDMDSAVMVLEQLANFLTVGGVERQKALLSEDDVLLIPAVKEFGTTDFSRMPESIPLGRQVAEAQLEHLKEFATDSSDYADYRLAKRQYSKQWTSDATRPVIAVNIRNMSKTSEKLIRETLGLEAGKAISANELNQALDNLYALNKYQRVDAQFINTDQGRVLDVFVIEKPWGPNYLEFGVSWEDNFNFKSSIQFDFSYTITDINRQGAYWRNEVQLGENRLLRSEFYQPIDETDLFYARAQYNFQDRDWPVYDDNFATLNFDKRLHNGELGIGTNYSRQGIIEVGGMYETGEIISRDAANTRFEYDIYGAYLSIGYDTLNSASFPTEGNQAKLHVRVVEERFRENGISGGYEPAFHSEFDWKGALKLGNSAVVGKFSAAYTNTDAEFSSYGSDLGGFLNLSGYFKDSLVGPKKLFGALIYQYDLGRTVLDMTQYPLYLGASIETGNVWQVDQTIDIDELIYAGSLFIGTDTQLGPAALGFGAAETGERAVYLFVGRVF